VLDSSGSELQEIRELLRELTARVYRIEQALKLEARPMAEPAATPAAPQRPASPPPTPKPRILRDQRSCYNETFGGFTFTLFDGTRITV
jgi:hypothetical protein